MEKGLFLCLCPPPYRGEFCQTGTQLSNSRTTTRQLSHGSWKNGCCCPPTVLLECRYKNGGCAQYCKDLPGGAGVQCGCADGYELHNDGRGCSKTGENSGSSGNKQSMVVSKGHAKKTNPHTHTHTAMHVQTQTPPNKQRNSPTLIQTDIHAHRSRETQTVAPTQTPPHQLALSSCASSSSVIPLRPPAK